MKRRAFLAFLAELPVIGFKKTPKEGIYRIPKGARVYYGFRAENS